MKGLSIFALIELFTPVATAIVVIISLRSNQATILKRLDVLEHTIEKAHDRIDRHIIEWHK